MTFSKEWDDRYEKNTNMSIWPWSDLISYVMRYSHPTNSKFCVLELGCGAGANIPFFTNLGIRYYAIEGSKLITSKLIEKFPNLKNNIITGDFTENIPFEESFDLVFDRSSLTHNTTKGIKNCLYHVYEKLNPKGKYIGIDWFSTLHFEYQKGFNVEDEFTKTGYKNGQFAYVGNVHFSDKTHLLDLFNKFHILTLDHKIIKNEIPNNGSTIATWNFVVQK